MTEQEQIAALKAHVNCLRVALMKAITFREGSSNYGNPEQVLESTPEQCLAEVKAKAVEDAVSTIHHFDLGIEVTVKLLVMAKQLREQAK